MLPRLVNIRFQNLFTPLAGVLFTFPSRYWFTIGHQVVFSLGRWSSRIPTGFLVSRCTQGTASPCSRFDYRAVTCSGWPFQAIRLRFHVLLTRPYNPFPRMDRFGLFPVRSPLLGESQLISFPRGTEMFQFPPFATQGLCIQPSVTWITPCRFPDSDIDGSTPVYGSPSLIAVLPRPSSPLGA